MNIVKGHCSDKSWTYNLALGVMGITLKLKHVAVMGSYKFLMSVEIILVKTTLKKLEKDYKLSSLFQ